MAESTTRPDETTNRRRDDRFECEASAEIYLPHVGLRISGQIADLSVSGCFIEAPSINLERGTQVEVTLQANHLSLRVCGNIVVLHPRRGVCIAFLHPSERTHRRIEELVAELKAGG